MRQIITNNFIVDALITDHFLINDSNGADSAAAVICGAFGVGLSTASGILLGHKITTVAVEALVAGTIGAQIGHSSIKEREKRLDERKKAATADQYNTNLRGIYFQFQETNGHLCTIASGMKKICESMGNEQQSGLRRRIRSPQT